MAALAALCVVFVPRERLPPPPPDNFAVVMAPAPPAPATERSLQTAQLPPATATVASSLSAPLPLSLAPAAQADLHVSRNPRHSVARPTLQVPDASPAPVASPAAVAVSTQAAPSAPAPVSRDALAGLEARIRQAVQEAAIYPASARVMHLEGRAQVRFDYTDGAVGVADIATSSSFGMLDRAALLAVRRAALPKAPSEIGARTLPLLVWVDFRLVRQD